MELTGRRFADEIEVTPEMTKAGGREIMAWAFDLVSGDSRLSGEAARAVFARMLELRHGFPV